MNEFMRELLFLPEQGSTLAERIDHLHFFIISVTMFSAAVIGAVGLFFLIRYRKREAAAATPVVHAPAWLEALFIGGPLSLFLLWFAIGFHDFVWASAPPKDALDVYVTAKQWMWTFSSADGPTELEVLHVPAGRPIRLLITSRDVVHSFFVPALRLKRDALPGRYTEAWFEAPRPGVHQVLCAEFCGLDHSVMRAEVVVMEPDDFEAWRARRSSKGVASAESGPLPARGQAVAAEAGCLRCHTLDGTLHLAPSFRGLYGKQELLMDGRRVLVDEQYLTESMMEPSVKVVAGYSPIMPSYFAQLSPAQVAALLELIKSLRAGAP